MDLNRGSAGVTGQCGHQPSTLTGYRTLLGCGQSGIRKHLGGGRFHQGGQIRGALGRVLPDMPAIRHGDMGAGDHR